MPTQKQYHDLVILDHENTGIKQIKAKKIVSGILFFLIGLFIGAVLVSLWNDKSKYLVQHPNTTQTIKTENTTKEIQSITSISGASKEEGCGIESLGRNNPEGCSADSFTETPLESGDMNSTGMTNLDTLGDSEEVPSDSNTNSDVTNILDLK